MASNRFLWTQILGEPGGAFLPSPNKVAEIFASRFLRAAQNFQFRDSDFATLIFKGKQKNKQLALPLHMQERHYDFIKKNLQRINIVTGKLDEIDNLDLQAVDGYSLSDFGSYCTQLQYKRCWDSIIALSTNNARFCELLFMVDHQLPFDILKIDEALSSSLSEVDKAIIYQIRIGRIEKNYV